MIKITKSLSRYLSHKPYKGLCSLSSEQAKSSSTNGSFEILDKDGVYITVTNSPGILKRILDTFANHQINLTHIESKLLNKTLNGDQEVNFHINFDGTKSHFEVQKCLENLKTFAQISFDEYIPVVPWFPRNLNDLDRLGKNLIERNEDAGKDHPLFKDKDYKKRRDLLAQASQSYSIHQPIPYTDYTDIENKTWNSIYSKLRPLQKNYMCHQFEESMLKFEKYCGMSPNKITQLKDISNYLQKETGFRLKPVHGILSQREFLNALAFRVFCCTQYIRHPANPEYTPEPDIVHELLGHAPMFAEKDFADLSQQIGLLSLGASEESITKMGTLYWYTVEYGACKEGKNIKAYGAGIASSIEELKHFGSGKAEFRELAPQKELPLDYPIQTLQNYYYVADSFKNAKDVLIHFGETLSRPFQAFYNSKSQIVETSRNVKTRVAEEKNNFSDIA